MYLQTWAQTFSTSLQNLWIGVVQYVPNIVIAIIILIVGWVIGVFVCKLIEQIFKSLRVDNLLKSAGIDTILERGGLKLDSGRFIGVLVEWFVILAFLVASLGVLGLTDVVTFLNTIVLQDIPHIIAAALILMAAAIVAEVLSKIIVASAKAAKVKTSGFLGNVVKWVIWVLAIVAALLEVGIGRDFLSYLLQGVVIAVSLAVGLAFGLGGQETVAKYLEKVRNDMNSKQ